MSSPAGDAWGAKGECWARGKLDRESGCEKPLRAWRRRGGEGSMGKLVVRLACVWPWEEKDTGWTDGFAA